MSQDLPCDQRQQMWRKTCRSGQAILPVLVLSVSLMSCNSPCRRADSTVSSVCSHFYGTGVVRRLEARARRNRQSAHVQLAQVLSLGVPLTPPARQQSKCSESVRERVRCVCGGGGGREAEHTPPQRHSLARRLTASWGHRGLQGTGARVGCIL